MLKELENLTQKEVNELFEEGYRPIEIYVYNDETVTYNGVIREPRSIEGWDIKHIFTKPEWVSQYPFFDTAIMLSSVCYCEEMFVPLNQINAVTDVEVREKLILARVEAASVIRTLDDKLAKAWEDYRVSDRELNLFNRKMELSV